MTVNMVVILQDVILCGLEVEWPFREAATSITGSYTMMMKAAASSETLAYFCKTIWHHIPEVNHHYATANLTFIF